MRKSKTSPAPLDVREGQQKDDNIDDLGRRPDGSEQDQPVKPDEKTLDKTTRKQQ